MEAYEVVWTNRAVKDLRKVYDFYAEQIGEEKAYQIIQGILNKVDVLSDARFARIGAVDEEFKHLKWPYKKLIQKHIKITYRLSINKPVVYINRLFDTRQHPRKNK